MPLLQSRTITRSSTFNSKLGFSTPDPFFHGRTLATAVANRLLATAFFHCWHILLLFAAWAVLICVLNSQGHNLAIQPTLLTVVGTVLGFVVSYRTTSSYERYNEGRKLWTQMITSTRMFARLIWLHVPDDFPTFHADLKSKKSEEEQKIPSTPAEIDERKARVLLEKKTAINLLEGYAVAVKHYLRGEDLIEYEDLYHLVKFLDVYYFPSGMPDHTRHTSLGEEEPRTEHPPEPHVEAFEAPPSSARLDAMPDPPLSDSTPSAPTDPDGLPMPVTTPMRRPTRRATITITKQTSASTLVRESMISQRISGPVTVPKIDDSNNYNNASAPHLQPARLPPRFHYHDLVPFSFLGRWTNKGKKAARVKTRTLLNHNIPLQIGLYLSSYITTATQRGTDVPTLNAMMKASETLVDCLTNLERVLTTPIPFSYSAHLWFVTTIYCMALPFQLWKTLEWITIPGTVIASFIFFGFLVAAEEIENPFGYDMNDLNLDYFTTNIIRTELQALTQNPAPKVADWVFRGDNDAIFTRQVEVEEGVKLGLGPGTQAPEEWVKLGYKELLDTVRREKLV